MMIRVGLLSAIVVCVSININAQNNQLSASEQKQGWKLLFDGQSPNGWRNYRSKTINPQWKVVDGTLTLAEKGGGDIITENQYENFELNLEWRIQDCGNSGIFFGVVEDTSYCCVFFTGPEMQILDDKCHPDNKLENHRAGALYDMITCSKPTVKPAGEWNQIRLVKKNGKVEQWQNGAKVVEYTMWTPEWDSMVAKSKFKDWKGFGKYKKGHLALQDHGDVVSFRNIKLKELP